MITVTPPIRREQRTLSGIEDGVYLVANSSGERFISLIEGRTRWLIGLDGVQPHPAYEIDPDHYTLLPDDEAITIRNRCQD